MVHRRLFLQEAGFKILCALFEDLSMTTSSQRGEPLSAANVVKSMENHTGPIEKLRYSPSMKKNIGMVIKPAMPTKRRKSKTQPPPSFVAEPVTQSNSFVGTEEYIALEMSFGWKLFTSIHLCLLTIRELH